MKMIKSRFLMIVLLTRSWMVDIAPTSPHPPNLSRTFAGTSSLRCEEFSYHNPPCSRQYRVGRGSWSKDLPRFRLPAQNTSPAGLSRSVFWLKPRIRVSWRAAQANSRFTRTTSATKDEIAATPPCLPCGCSLKTHVDFISQKLNFFSRNSGFSPFVGLRGLIHGPRHC